MLGIQLRASCTPGKHSTSEPRPSPNQDCKHLRPREVKWCAPCHTVRVDRGLVAYSRGPFLNYEGSPFPDPCAEMSIAV
jgi:hypothetical protein